MSLPVILISVLSWAITQSAFVPRGHIYVADSVTPVNLNIDMEPFLSMCTKLMDTIVASNLSMDFSRALLEKPCASLQYTFDMAANGGGRRRQERDANSFFEFDLLSPIKSSATSAMNSMTDQAFNFTNPTVDLHEEAKLQSERLKNLTEVLASLKAERLVFETSTQIRAAADEIWLECGKKEMGILALMQVGN